VSSLSPPAVCMGRVYPFPQPPVWTYTVQGVSLSTASNMDVQGVSLFTASSMNVHGVSFSSSSSMDVQDVPFFKMPECQTVRHPVSLVPE
jgi:hypothetical protein